MRLKKLMNKWSAPVVASLMLASPVLADPHAPPPPSPKALGVEVACGLIGVSGDPNDVAGGGEPDCDNVDGWFDGKLEWYDAGGNLLYTERGPFFGTEAGGNNHVLGAPKPDEKTAAVNIFVDGNNDPTDFKTFYLDPSSMNVFEAQGLHFRLYITKDAGKKNEKTNLLTEQWYKPVASAFWSDRAMVAEATRFTLFTGQDITGPDGATPATFNGSGDMTFSLATNVTGVHNFANGSNTYNGVSANLSNSVTTTHVVAADGLYSGNVTSGSLNTGPLFAASGDFTGPLLGTTGAFSGGLSSASLATGPITATTGSYSGALSSASLTTGAVQATTGDFSGALHGTSATFSGPFSGTTGTFSGGLSSSSLTTGGIVAASGMFSGPISGSSISVSGNVSGSSANISGLLSAGGINTGNINAANINASSASFSGAVSASSFSGDGSNLRNLNGNNVQAGSIPNSALQNSTFGVDVRGQTGLLGGGIVGLGETVGLSLAINHDGTLKGNGGNSSLGIDFGSQNTWSGTQTFDQLVANSLQANTTICLKGDCRTSWPDTSAEETRAKAAEQKLQTEISALQITYVEDKDEYCETSLVLGDPCYAQATATCPTGTSVIGCGGRYYDADNDSGVHLVRVNMDYATNSCIALAKNDQGPGHRGVHVAATASCLAGVGAPAVLPVGTYSHVCTGCSVTGNTLTCNCEGNTTSLTLPCNGDISDNHGHLQCG